MLTMIAPEILFIFEQSLFTWIFFCDFTYYLTIEANK